MKTQDIALRDETQMKIYIKIRNTFSSSVRRCSMGNGFLLDFLHEVILCRCYLYPLTL